MRAVVKQHPERGADYVTDWREADCEADEVRLDIAAASICGTDRELYDYGPAAQAFNLNFPVVIGHECAGTVIETGHNVRGLSVGDRVALESHIPCWQCFACRTGSPHNCQQLRILGMHIDGTFAERTVVPQSICFAIPEAMALEDAALLEPVGVGMHAIQRAGVSMGGAHVIVSGCGPVGLVIVHLAIALGAAQVVAIEPNAFRAGLAEQAGATVVAPGEPAVAHCRRQAGARGGFDVAFEASGAGAALPTLLEALRREARLVTIGHPGEPNAVDIAAHINKKGIVLAGVFGRRLWDTWETLVALIENGRFDPNPLITHRLPLNRFEHALDLLNQKACKIVLRPDLEDAA